MAEAVRYSNSVTVRCQPEVTALVERAAQRRGQKPSEYVRQALLTGLRLDGFDPADIAPRDAGSLYNVTPDGRRKYAIVSAGRMLVDTLPLAECPDIADANHYPAGYVPADGDRWVPIEYEDSQPFDPAEHYRLAPMQRIEADRVVRTYPVIPKSEGI